MSDYNGWKNYPTWCVNLWLENDQGVYTTIAHAVASMKRSKTLTRVDLADWLKEMVEDLLPAYSLEASMGADLLGYAMDQVDWFEVADGWIESAEA